VFDSSIDRCHRGHRFNPIKLPVTNERLQLQFVSFDGPTCNKQKQNNNNNNGNINNSNNKMTTALNIDNVLAKANRSAVAPFPRPLANAQDARDARDARDGSVCVCVCVCV